jgi:hypothetical protein
LHIPRRDGPVSWLNEANFDIAWNALVEAGLPLRDKATAWADLQVRGSYGDQLEELIDFLVAPHGFWGHSAEETVVEEVAAAASVARRRALGG